MKDTPFRRLRSFVRREGRFTKAQRLALKDLWPTYGLALRDGMASRVVPSDQPWVLEIGFGMGASFVSMAEAHPDEQYIGIEVHRPGVGSVLAAVAEKGLKNVHVYAEDAVLVCEDCLEDASLDRVQIFFPDPWPKKRHHKRRLIQFEFMTLLAQKMKPGGTVHLATDVACYAEHMRVVLSAHPDFEPVDDLTQLGYQRPMTKFEKAGTEKGHAIVDWVYRKK